MTSVRVVNAGFMGFACLMAHVLPYLYGKRLFRSGSAGAKSIRRYELRVLPWTIAGLAAASFLPLAWSLSAGAVLLGAGTMLAYARAWQEARRFAAADSGIREAGLSDPGGDVRRVAWRFLPALAMLGAVALYLRARWEQIPSRFAVHWTLSGAPNGWSYKSVAGVYGPLLLGASSVLFLAGLCLAILLGSRRGSPRPVVISLTTVVAYFVTAIFAFLGILALHAVPAWVMIVVVLGYFGVLGRIVFRSMTAADSSEDAAAPAECWHGGQFYWNPEDPALFVQTRVGNFYTVNFGNRASWFLTGLMALYAAIMVCLARAIWG